MLAIKTQDIINVPTHLNIEDVITVEKMLKKSIIACSIILT